MLEIPQNLDFMNIFSRPKIATEENREPFLIRGHHLRFFYSVLNHYKEHGSAAPAIMSVEHVRNWQSKQLRAQAKSANNPQQESLARYFKDFIGDTPQEHVLYQQKYQKTLEQFLKLPDDHPAELVQRQDAMCGNCKIGNHCKRLWEANDDKHYLTIFESENKKNKNKPLIIIEELVDFSNAKMQKTTAILTDIGTVKKTLTTTPYAMWDSLPPPQPPHS